MPSLSYKLICPLLIIGCACKSQSENIIAANSKQINITNPLNGNQNTIAKSAIQQIDSIAQTNSLPGHFCKVYNKSMQNIALQIKDIDVGAKMFIQKFETGFANYFLKECYANANGDALTGSVWQCYFLNQNAQPWQLVLIGVNAHINGDIWHALIDNFSEKEIRCYKKEILATQPSIAKVYNEIFDTLRSKNSYLRFINAVTLGLAKKFGERLFYKWRRRNVNLAILYYHNPEKFKRKFAVVSRKKQKIDQIILKYTS